MCVVGCYDGLLVSVCCFGEAEDVEVSSAEFFEAWLMHKNTDASRLPVIMKSP